MGKDSLILGAGITGLTAGLHTGWTVLEASDTPGGFCGEYTLAPGYRFSVGGGHWIFSPDHKVLEFIAGHAALTPHIRRAGVYLPSGKIVPYPLQNNLRVFDAATREKVLGELAAAPARQPHSLKEWLETHFGETLGQLFFRPFHERYTAGLYETIAPQDLDKSPCDIDLIRRGCTEETPPVGYNRTFFYPRQGMNELIARLATGCDVRTRMRVVGVDPDERLVSCEDGSHFRYRQLISTLPLNQTLALAGLSAGCPEDPYISVLVLNIGARKGAQCPAEDWLYMPASRAGFYRVGFYSNVDRAFLPDAGADHAERVSIYVERAYPGGRRPSESELGAYAAQAIAELQEWGFIKDVEVLDYSWGEVAYTWSWIASPWRARALAALEQRGIYPMGRYGRWHFQGIGDSVKEGMDAARLGVAS